MNFNPVDLFEANRVRERAGDCLVSERSLQRITLVLRVGDLRADIEAPAKRCSMIRPSSDS